MMEAIAKAIEVLGQAVRPAVFGCLVVAVVALCIPPQAWLALGENAIPIPRWWCVGVIVFGLAYLTYEPFENWVSARREDGAATAEAKRLGKVVEGLSARARTWLYVLLENNQMAFDWKTNGELAKELDSAGVIRPQQAISNTRMRFVLADWYWHFATVNRVWLHANLKPDPDLLTKFRAAYIRATDDEDDRI